MLYFERKFRKQGYDIIIGVDEVGRGALAGPVVAAAVYLKKRACFKNRIDDSKKLTPLQRHRAYLEIVGNSLYGIGIINEGIIDRLNIFVATRLAMENAIEELSRKFGCLQRLHILIDGTVKPAIKTDFTNIIRGDSRSKSIACASILAKVSRDRIMSFYEKVYPQYGFLQHKGYGTEMHISRLRQYGLALIHRRSFCGALL